MLQLFSRDLFVRFSTFIKCFATFLLTHCIVGFEMEIAQFTFPCRLTFNFISFTIYSKKAVNLLLHSDVKSPVAMSRGVNSFYYLRHCSLGLHIITWSDSLISCQQQTPCNNFHILFSEVYVLWLLKVFFSLFDQCLEDF